MDLRVYYQKIREVEAEVKDDHTVIVSLKGDDGGPEGVKTEVSKSVAARMVVDGRARLATKEEIDGFHAKIAEARKRFNEERVSDALQVALISESQMNAFKKSRKG